MFRTETELLHWALNASDPEALRDAAAKASPVADKTLEESRRDVREALEHLAVPPVAELIAAAAEALRAAESFAPRLEALQALQALAEPVDAANDLEGLGGVAALEGVLVGEVARAAADRTTDEELSQSAALFAAAAHALGTACANNRPFQDALLERFAPSLGACLDVAGGGVAAQFDGGEARAKALYALGACAREHEAAIASLLRAGLAEALGEALHVQRGGTHAARRKALALIADLARFAPALWREMAPREARAAAIVAAAGAAAPATCEDTDLATRAAEAAGALARAEDVGGAQMRALLGDSYASVLGVMRTVAACQPAHGADDDVLIDMRAAAIEALEALGGGGDAS